MKKFTIFMLMLTSFQANAYHFCEGKIETVWTEGVGNVYIVGSWRKDHTQICNLTSTWNGVQRDVCKAWLSAAQLAYAEKFNVTVRYNDDNIKSCSTIPVYGAAPAPNYIMLTQRVSNTKENNVTRKLRDLSKKKSSGNFKLVVWNIANTRISNDSKHSFSLAFNKKLAYMKSFSGKGIPTYYLLQETANNQHAKFDRKFPFYKHVNGHNAYNTASATNEAVEYFYSTNLSSKCRLKGDSLKRGAIVFRPKTDNVLLINVHLSTSRVAGERSCVIKELAQLVKNYDGNLIVAGDFNLFDNAKEYRNFLSQTNLSDEGIESGVDHIAYRGCRLISTDQEPLVNLSDHRLLHATFNCNK